MTRKPNAANTGTAKALILKTNCVGRQRSMQFGTKYYQRVKQNYTECKLLIEYVVDDKPYKTTITSKDKNLYIEGEFINIKYNINNPTHVWLDDNSSWRIIAIICTVIMVLVLTLKFASFFIY